MVKLTTFLLAILYLSAGLIKAEVRPLPPRENKMVWNFTYAIAKYYETHKSIPLNLSDIKDHTDLRIDFDSKEPDSFPSRYAIVQDEVIIPKYGRIALISLDTLVSDRGEETPGLNGRLIGFIKSDGSPGATFLSEDTVLSALPNDLILKPIGGAIPAPSWAKEPSNEPIQTEYEKRVDEAFARGEIPITPRNDKEQWRDQPPETKPVEIPAAAPASAPTSPTKQPANLVWWIVGLIILVAVVVFVTRKKNPKT